MMGPVKVLVTHRLTEDLARQISSVDPRLKVTCAAEELSSELRQEGAAKAPQPGPLDALLAEAEVIVTMMVPRRLLERAPKLRWVQLTSAGIDHLRGTGLLESKNTITNARGVFSIPIAEHVLCFMLMLAKQALSMLEAQRKHQWNRLRPLEVYGETVGLVGMGSIAQEVAKRAKAFGMKVIATRRSATKLETRLGAVEELYPPARLGEMLGRCDFVVLTIPLTPQTKTIIGERELRAMKPTAYLINIARGEVIDEPALIRALKEGWIAGAGLDVFATEPLPPESELWDLPNVILTPHITSGKVEVSNVRLTELICENLRRYLAGQELLNLVDKEAGY